MRARKKRKYYKNTDSWLDAVYRANKEYIDYNLPEGIKNKKASFKNAVKGYIEEDQMSPEQALKALENSRIFTPQAIHMSKNLVSAMKDMTYEVMGKNGKKKTISKYDEFRRMVRDSKGHFQAIDYQRFRWDPEQHNYYYITETGDIIVIWISNSPQEIIFEYL